MRIAALEVCNTQVLETQCSQDSLRRDIDSPSTCDDTVKRKMGDLAATSNVCTDETRITLRWSARMHRAS